MTVAGCLGCDLLSGRRPVPGGIVYQSAWWAVNHVVGPLNVGTLVVGPREHVTSVSDLAEQAAVELGPLLRRTTRVIEALIAPEQIYVCLWSHGQALRKHLHFVVQPVTTALVERHGGLRSEQLQAVMFRSGTDPDPTEVEQFCRQARDLFASWPDDET